MLSLAPEEGDDDLKPPTSPVMDENTHAQILRIMDNMSEDEDDGGWDEPDYLVHVEDYARHRHEDILEFGNDDGDEGVI